jgi:hypothetical protein
MSLSPELVAGLLGAVAGAACSFCGSLILMSAQNRRSDDATKAQLVMLLRALERLLIVRRDNASNPIAGFDQTLQRLIDRAYSHDAGVAIHANQIHDFYKRMGSVELAAASLQYMIADTFGKVPSQRRVGEMTRAAAAGCDDLAAARIILGDHTRLSSLVSEHQPDN